MAVVKMSEDTKQREIRLRKELAQLRKINANESRTISKNRDFTAGNTHADTSHKSIPTTRDIPDVVSLPANKRGKKENIPF